MGGQLGANPESTLETEVIFDEANCPKVEVVSEDNIPQKNSYSFGRRSTAYNRLPVLGLRQIPAKRFYYFLQASLPGLNSQINGMHFA